MNKNKYVNIVLLGRKDIKEICIWLFVNIVDVVFLCFVVWKYF